MPTITRALKRPETPQPLRGTASWLALLTATTLTSRSDIVRAEVRTTDAVANNLAEVPHRLVVQVYPTRAVVGGVVQRWARPTASAQRAVTRDELADGVPVHLVDFGRVSADAPDPSVVVAWVEPGDPDLELDGMDARPCAGSSWAVAPLRAGRRSVRLRLRDRKAA